MRLLRPQFFAEDGLVFFQQLHDGGFWRTLVSPTAGYLNTVPRLVAGAALALPLAWSPLVYAVAAFLVQAAPLGYLFSGRLRRHLPDRRLQALAAAVYVAVPNSYETYVTLTNIQWNLALVALVILIAEPPAGRWACVLEAAFLGVFSLTGPLCMILLPLALFNVRSRWNDAAKPWSIACACVLAGGAAVQALLLVTTPRVTPWLRPEAPLSPQELMKILSVHVFYNSILGIRGTMRALPSLGGALQAAGMVAALLLALFVVVRRHRALVPLLLLAAATVFLSFLFPVSGLREWLQPGFGPRYYTYATLFILYAVLLLVCQNNFLRLAGVLLALPALGVGIPSDFIHVRRSDTAWPDQVAVFESLPQGASFFVPIQPLDYGGIELRKRTPERAASPLAQARKLEGRPACAAYPPALASSPLWGRRMFLRLSGWAADTESGKAAGGVWVVIDDRPFPAIYGQEDWSVETSLGDPRYRYTGFSRLIPLEEIGAGRHRLSLAVLTHDRSGYYLVPGEDFNVSPYDLTFRSE